MRRLLASATIAALLVSQQGFLFEALAAISASKAVSAANSAAAAAAGAGVAGSHISRIPLKNFPVSLKGPSLSRGALPSLQVLPALNATLNSQAHSNASIQATADSESVAAPSESMHYAAGASSAEQMDRRVLENPVTRKAALAAKSLADNKSVRSISTGRRVAMSLSRLFNQAKDSSSETPVPASEASFAGKTGEFGGLERSGGAETEAEGAEVERSPAALVAVDETIRADVLEAIKAAVTAGRKSIAELDSRIVIRIQKHALPRNPVVIMRTPWGSTMFYLHEAFEMQRELRFSRWKPWTWRSRLADPSTMDIGRQVEGVLQAAHMITQRGAARDAAPAEKAKPKLIEVRLEVIKHMKEAFKASVTKPNKQDYTYLATKTFGLNLAIRLFFVVQGVATGGLGLTRAIASTAWYQIQDAVFTVFGQTYMKFLNKMTGFLRIGSVKVGDFVFIYGQLVTMEFINRLLLGPLGENPLVYTWAGMGLIFANVLMGMISGGPLVPAINKMHQSGAIKHSTMMHLYQISSLALHLGLLASFGFQSLYLVVSIALAVLSWGLYLYFSIWGKTPVEPVEGPGEKL